MSANKILLDTDNRMKKTVEVLGNDLAAIRTGRASSGLVGNIKTDYHGVPTPINQLATINIPEARMIVIQPWDRGSIHIIEKAILKSELGLNPINDGNFIRVPVPPLSEERRHELTKVVQRKTEEGKVSLRNVRRDSLERLKEAERNKEISQDQLQRFAEQLQGITDSFIEKVNEIGQKKAAEILEA